jgi:hypothetical protein
MRKLAGAMMVAIFISTPVAAMDVATFLRGADALEAMGIRAMFPSRARVVVAEMNAITSSLRAERATAQAQRRRQDYGPDANNRVSPQELIASRRTIPTAGRPQVQSSDAMRAVHARRCPCTA